MIKFLSVFLTAAGAVFVLALVDNYNGGSGFYGYLMAFIICGLLFEAGFLAAYKK